MPLGLLNLNQFCTLNVFCVMNFGSPVLFFVHEIEGGFLDDFVTPWGASNPSSLVLNSRNHESPRIEVFAF